MKEFSIIFLTFSLFSLACTPSLPEKNSDANAAALRSFYIGLGALQVGDDVRAKDKLAETVRLAGGEPAAWTNLGVLQTRHKDFENAAASFEKAKQLAPDNAVVYSNIAVLETQRGNFEAAIANLKKTIELAPNDLVTIYALGQEYERQSADEEALKLYSRIYEARPSNIAIRLEIARLVAKTGDAKVFESVLSDIGKHKNKWPSEAQEQFERAYDSTNDLRQGAIATAYLKNILLRDSHFRANFAELRPSETVIGQPILKPLKLAAPDFKPANPDFDLKFTVKHVADRKARFAKAAFLNGDGEPVVAWSDEKELRVGETSLPFALESANGLATVDLDYDFRNDFALAGEKGFRLFRQTGDGTFSDVTAQTKLSNAILQRSYAGVWPFDVESDGDLDLVLASKSGPAV
ncbi:MAG: tetratricopeptide repeat protein, partial [Pyrinomonadaceae bacterium]